MTLIGDADTLYLGDTLVDKIYLGETLVWPIRFSPLDFADLGVWLDADSLGGTGSSIPTWADQSGNGRNFTNYALAAPTVSANTLNGHKLVRGTPSSGLRWEGTGLTGNFTAFCVARLVPGGVPGRVFGSIYPSHQNFLIGWWNGWEEIFYAEGFLNDAGKIAPTGTFKVMSMRGGGPTTAYVNGVAKETSGLTASFNNGVALGGYDPNGTQELSDSEIAEVIIYNRQISDDEKGQVDTYLSEKYNL